MHPYFRVSSQVVVRVAWATVFSAFPDCVADQNPHGVLAVSVDIVDAGVLPRSSRGDGRGVCSVSASDVVPLGAAGVVVSAIGLIELLGAEPTSRNLSTI